MQSQKLAIFVALSVLFFIISCASLSENEIRRTKNKVFYLKAPLWYENPEAMTTVNYQRGVRIPIGREVHIIDYTLKKIVFVTKTGFRGILHRSKKYCKISQQELFDRYFSKENIMEVGGAFYKLTTSEQARVKRGEVEIGMSKDAVLMAYGYPPSHKTPNLNSDIWIYWLKRRPFPRIRKIYFYDNKVIKIQ